MTNPEDLQHDFERRPPRDFIKENVNNIRQIQGVIQMQKTSKMKFGDKFRTIPSWASRKNTPEKKEKPSDSQKARDQNKSGKKSEVNLKARSEIKKVEKKSEIIPDLPQKYSHRCVQTERTDDPTVLYETGVIKYSSFKPYKAARPDRPQNPDGDFEEIVDDGREKNYIKENMVNLKPKQSRQITSKVPAEVPPTYQKGKLPKYLQSKKEEIKSEEDSCPVGHVLLPESERKETLKVLRESYADRIQELNALPVRSDTLRVKKRKQEIEEELKKLDSGIKVFQRPRVYVKINS